MCMDCEAVNKPGALQYTDFRDEAISNCFCCLRSVLRCLAMSFVAWQFQFASVFQAPWVVTTFRTPPWDPARLLPAITRLRHMSPASQIFRTDVHHFLLLGVGQTGVASCLKMLMTSSCGPCGNADRKMKLLFAEFIGFCKQAGLGTPALDTFTRDRLKLQEPLKNNTLI